MTTKFNPTPSSPEGLFPSAAFCVFSNRFLAVIVATLTVKYKHGELVPAKAPPLMAFGPCAFSNTCSSWAQYASLSYVSFPVQTVFKSSKVIPVMLMGRLLKGTNYGGKDYAEAGLITLGVFIFSYFWCSSSFTFSQTLSPPSGSLKSTNSTGRRTATSTR